MMELSDMWDCSFVLISPFLHQVSQFWFLGNETQRFTEFLEVLGGKPVDIASLPEPLQSLCLQSSTYWARKAAGESPEQSSMLEKCTVSAQAPLGGEASKWRISTGISEPSHT